jgi:hypothetical protein
MKVVVFQWPCGTFINEPFALRSPAIEAGHLGGGSGLIDEDKLFWIKG